MSIARGFVFTHQSEFNCLFVMHRTIAAKVSLTGMKVTMNQPTTASAQRIVNMIRNMNVIRYRQTRRLLMPAAYEDLLNLFNTATLALQFADYSGLKQRIDSDVR